ncbi:hypothetical protein HIM_07044 [Hirsutella minnesotensis 3608]|uniref:NADH-ubiquinone oxidoreductase 17.8 kDa subunit n=1 Tax=Hirsutella minnesotensis 3608 TaxID=1043627 RepID=A0A0F7ZTP8_9HYPO|nr:hypothetical protein HIM_07044 [Hirsutella minnesotensis 3608]
MFATRQRVGCLARQLQRTTRRHASDAHGHHKPAEVNESFGTGSIVFVSVVFGGALVYQFIPKKGDESMISNLIDKYRSRPEDWERINSLHTKVMEQAGYDRNLFENASHKHRFVDVSYPEALQSHAPRNVRAGQLRNLDDVVEHYRQQHLKDEERKAKKLAEQQ